MTNEEMTQHPTPSPTEQSPVSDENPTLHGSIATEAPVTQEIPDTPQPAQVTPPAVPVQPAKTGSAPHVSVADGIPCSVAGSGLVGGDLSGHHDRQRRGTRRPRRPRPGPTSKRHLPS